MESKMAAVGFCCADVYQKLNLWYPTGNGVDWGVHLARKGLSVAVISAVGDDAYGQEMKNRLQKENIDISHLRTDHGSTCQMLMDLRNGTDRVHLEEISGVMADYQITKEEFDYVAEFSYLHTDLFGGVLEHLEDWKAAGVKIVMDFSTFTEDPQYHCEEIFPFVDYVFFSFEGDDMEHLRLWMKQIHSFGVKIVVATLGEKGSIAYDGEDFYEYGIINTQVVNTVGAGDSYIAGFTYGITQGWTIPECMKLGAEISSAVISKFEPY